MANLCGSGTLLENTRSVHDLSSQKSLTLLLSCERGPVRTCCRLKQYRQRTTPPATPRSHALRGRQRLDFREPGVRRRPRPVRLRQDDASEHHRRPGPATRPATCSSTAARRSSSATATGTPTATTPSASSSRATTSSRTRRVLANVELALTLSGVSRKRAPRPRHGARWRRSASATSCTSGRTRCPAARCSASPSPAPSSTTRRSCWPTSRPARWTPRPSVQIMEILKEIAHDKPRHHGHAQSGAGRALRHPHHPSARRQRRR